MAFKFRLQTVLEHRRHLEDQAKARFARSLGAQRQAENHIAWLEDEHNRARSELQGKQVDGMPAPEFIMQNEYVTVLRLQSMREQARLPMLRAETERHRRKLVEATRERKVLEVLRDGHRARWEREQLLAEQRMLDEAAVNAHVRRRWQ